MAQKNNHLHFVEIRRRIGDGYGQALESITSKKISRIRKTAEYLLMQEKKWQDFVPFFSVVAIDENERGEVNIEFLPDAFSGY